LSNNSKLISLISKIFIFYKFKNYNQVIFYINKFSELAPEMNIEETFEELILHLTQGAGLLKCRLTKKEEETLDNIKNFIYQYLNYVETNDIGDSQELKEMLEDNDETIPPELQEKYTYTLEELMDGFEGSQKSRISM
jgi:hypothetical protein